MSFGIELFYVCVMTYADVVQLWVQSLNAVARELQLLAVAFQILLMGKRSFLVLFEHACI